MTATCHVCRGTGQVPVGSYAWPAGSQACSGVASTTASTTVAERCRACGGTGQVPVAGSWDEALHDNCTLRARIAELRRTLRWIADQPFVDHDLAALVRQMATCARIALDEDLP